MSEHYQSMLQKGSRIEIPPQIRNLQQFLLRPNMILGQFLEQERIILYKQFGETTIPDMRVCIIDEEHTIQLAPEYLEQLKMPEGEPLYFSITEDLIVIEKANCEKCGGAERLVEYIPYRFMCTPCIAHTIKRDKERGR